MLLHEFIMLKNKGVTKKNLPGNNNGGLNMKSRMAVVVSLCISLVCGIVCVQAYAQGGKITVYNPMGTPPPIQMKAMAPRLDTLDGKTIYLFTAGFPNSDNFMIVLKEWFADNHPKTNVIFPQPRIDDAMKAEIKEKGDAVLFAVGH